MTKTKKYIVPILTDEYHIVVLIGVPKKMVQEISRYTGLSKEEVWKDLDHCRGRSYNTLPNRSPLVVVNGTLPAVSAIATLAHEASHAMDFISDFVGIHDGEFKAHGIGRTVRALKMKL